MISDATWDRYKNILDDFHNDAFQQDLTWKHVVSSRGRYNEGSTSRDVDTTLKGLVQYNVFRNWPITKTSVAGETDEESLLVYFNYEYLNGLSLINANNQFDFNPDLDRFQLEGLTYKAMGDSKAAQAKDKTILVFIILQREETLTGEAER